MDGLYQIAYDYMNGHGKYLDGKPLGPYLIHGLGHSNRPNVDDPFDYGQPLELGVVVTMETGIYINEEKIGIRIEDDILITKDGYRLLTPRPPRTAEHAID
jgi:Xaa-Pro aminopeptidase